MTLQGPINQAASGRGTPINAILVESGPSTKISAMISGSPAQNTDEIPINRGGSNFKLTIADILSMGGRLLDGNTNGSVKSFGTLDDFDVPFVVNGFEVMRMMNSVSFNLRLRTILEDLNGFVAFDPQFKCVFDNSGNIAGDFLNYLLFNGAERTVDWANKLLQNSLVSVNMLDRSGTQLVHPQLTGAGNALLALSATGQEFRSVDPALISTAWQFNGNTVGVQRSFGTIDNFDIPFIVNNTTRATLQGGLWGNGRARSFQFPDGSAFHWTAPGTDRRAGIGSMSAGTATDLIIQSNTSDTNSNIGIYGFQFRLGASATTSRFIVNPSLFGSNNGAIQSNGTAGIGNLLSLVTDSDSPWTAQFTRADTAVNFTLFQTNTNQLYFSRTAGGNYMFVMDGANGRVGIPTGFGVLPTAWFDIRPSTANEAQLRLRMGGTAPGAPNAGDVYGTGTRQINFQGSLAMPTLGDGLMIQDGVNARIGTATLVAGTVTVPNTSITANTKIFITPTETGLLVGVPRVTARTVGTDFTISTGVGTDTATIDRMLVEAL